MTNKNTPITFQLIFIFYLVFSLAFGTTVLIIGNLNGNTAQIAFAITTYSPMFVVILVQILLPLYVKYKKYCSSFWKSLFTLFFFNSKKSKEILIKFENKNWIFIYKFFFTTISILALLIIAWIITAFIKGNLSTATILTLICWLLIFVSFHIFFALKAKKYFKALWTQD